MRKIIEEYGKMLIVFLVAGIIFSFFLSAGAPERTGFAETLGGWIAGQSSMRLTEYDSTAFDFYAGTGKLDMEYTGVPIVAGEKTAVTDHFRATLESGEQAEIAVCIIRDSRGTSYHTQIEEGKEYMYLEEAGIYTVYFLTRDSCGRQQYAMLRIPVQRQ